MTAPANEDERTPLALPGEFPEPDLVLADMLTLVEVDGVPLGPDHTSNDVTGIDSPCFHCYVPPGRRQVGPYGDIEESFVYVGAWGEDWTQANGMQKAVRALLKPYADGGVWKGVQLHRLREATGPAAIPRRPDAPEELVESGWLLRARPHRGGTVRP